MWGCCEKANLLEVMPALKRHGGASITWGVECGYWWEGCAPQQGHHNG